MDLAQDLLQFIQRAPTPYHAVAEGVRLLRAAGFRRIEEGDRWSLSPGDRFAVVRNDGSLIAGIVGRDDPAAAGFRILGAHTDSPNLRVKPNPDLSECGYQQIALEPYGGVLLYTWFDRELSLAGRVVLLRNGKLETRLVNFERPVLHVPSLAIHLQREIREEGLRLNPQLHISGMLGLGKGISFREHVAARIREETGQDTPAVDILAFDLMAFDTRPPERVGAAGEFLCSARLDNLASCHAALRSLLDSADEPCAGTRLIVLYDHEEIGSRSTSGAAGPFLESVLTRIAENTGNGADKAAAFARSRLVSVDMAHAVHPNWPDRHERSHRPVIGGGLVLKVNVNQSYATDAATAAEFLSLCRDCDVPVQHFVSRSDFVCGSTIGPIAATRTGIATVDVGNPMLAMHSCREVAGTSDVAPMVRALTRFLAS